MSNRIKYTQKDYKEKCENLNMEYVGFHNKKGKGTIIDFICPIHKDKGIQSTDWGHFRTAKYGCPYCTGRYKTTQDVQKQIYDLGIDVKLISPYQGCEKPIRCKCNKCGYEWTTVSKVFTTNKSGCPQCAQESRRKTESKTQEQFITDLNKINPDIEVLGTYVNTHTKIKCKCKICGHVLEGYPANLLNGSAGCPECHMSVGQKRMIHILIDELHLKIDTQHSFDDCRYKQPLRFDAYDTEHNIAFEYNGQQHYFPVDFTSKDYELAKEQFVVNQQRDLVKINYCKNNNIPLIIVPYWQFKNMDSFIKNTLNKIQKERNNS